MESNLTEHLQIEDTQEHVADFTYDPLDAERQEFRTLTVHPSSGYATHTIRATIATRSLLEKPQYETVSYCWGDASIRSTIILNGYRFDVPASSEKTLRRMQRDDADRVLWIDAICINQMDIDERSQQVAFMDRIYSSGTRNLIWLGEAELDHADDAVKAFNAVWQGIVSCTGNGNIMPVIWNADKSHGQPVQSLVVGPDFDYEPILRVFRKPWFRRLWVVQEAALSASNICFFGHRELDLLQALKVCKWLLQSSMVLPFNLVPEPGIMNASEMWSFVDPFLRPPHRYYRGFLTKAMLTVKNFEATEPKDYFYGVLGLAPIFVGHQLAKDPLLLPDYRRTLKDTFIRAAQYSIKETGELELFNMVFRRKVDREDSTWPSWLPRWNRAHELVQDAYPLSRNHRAGITKGQTAKILAHKTDRGLAMFFGFIIDTVKHANEPLPIPMNDIHDDVQYTFDDIAKSYNDVEATFEQHANDNDRQESQRSSVLGLTLAAGIDRLNRPLTPQSAAEAFLLFDGYMQQGTLPPDIDDVTPADGPAYLASETHLSMRAMWTHRRFFATAVGSFGLGPALMAPRDRVAVLYGCRFPVILRPLEHGTYEFMGVAYVHRVMEGQLIDGELKDRRGPDMEIWMR